MTDEETHKTGELLMSLEGKHSIIVIEHDMTFVRDRRKVTVLHQGTVLCEGTVDEESAEQRKSHRGLSWTAKNTEPRLAITKLNVSYDGSQILRNVSLAVPPKQVVCLMGRNGVGKTTTLKSIVGLVKPTSGAIQLEGKPLDDLSPDGRARSGVGYVPQGRDIFPHLTVWENLKISLVVHGKKANGQVRSRVRVVPGPQGNAGAKGRGPERRPATTARHRPRPADRSQGADPRRADRGHPALRSSRTSAAPSRSGAARRHGDRAGRTDTSTSPAARRQFCGDGPRHGNYLDRASSAPRRSAGQMAL